MTLQSFAAVARQVVAIAAIVMGAVTAALPSLGLPTDVSAILVAAGGAVIAIEHYVSDPSTGSTSQVPS